MQTCVILSISQYNFESSNDKIEFLYKMVTNFTDLLYNDKCFLYHIALENEIMVTLSKVISM